MENEKIYGNAEREVEILKKLINLIQQDIEAEKLENDSIIQSINKI